MTPGILGELCLQLLPHDVRGLLQRILPRAAASSGSSLETPALDVLVPEVALAVRPDLALEAASHDQYVFMHFDGQSSLGVSCDHGVCHEFQPVLERTSAGLVLWRGA